MVYKPEQWKNRIASRSDITGMVTHLTKPSCDAKNLRKEKINQLATENLIKILKDGVIKGSTTQSGFIIGSTPAVCFQDAPFYGLIQNIEHEYQRQNKNSTERKRYCGVGLAFSKREVFQKGGRPVFYEETEIAKKLLHKSEYWRIVNFSIPSNSENMIDWTHEREWRLPNDMKFEVNLAHVVLYDKKCWDFFIENCPEEIFKKIYGITILKSIMM